MKFSDLDFKPHRNHLSGVQALHFFDNNYGVSVVKTPYSYGGDEGLYEMAVMKKDCGICYNTPITDDVLGNLTPNEVESYMQQVERLEKDKY